MLRQSPPNRNQVEVVRGAVRPACRFVGIIGQPALRVGEQAVQVDVDSCGAAARRDCEPARSHRNRRRRRSTVCTSSTPKAANQWRVFGFAVPSTGSCAARFFLAWHAPFMSTALATVGIQPKVSWAGFQHVDVALVDVVGHRQALIAASPPWRIDGCRASSVKSESAAAKSFADSFAVGPIIWKFGLAVNPPGRPPPVMATSFGCRCDRWPDPASHCARSTRTARIISPAVGVPRRAS